MAPSKALPATVHTIIRRTIGQYYVNKAVQHGATRATVQPGSVTFVQRFGGSINLHRHVHVLFLEGVFVDRTAQGLRPRFLHQTPPTDVDIATVLQNISRRVIRARRRLGYLEAGTEDVVPMGYDPVHAADPELARTMAASVQQRIACGERAGPQVRRIGSGCGDDGEHPILTGTRCASVNGFSLHANTHMPAPRRDPLERLLRSTARGAVSLERLEQDANGDLRYTFTRPWSEGTTGITRSPLELVEQRAARVPLPRVPLVRSGGCLAPQSKLRGAIIPTPCQQGVAEPEACTPSPHWRWARPRKRVCAIDMERCPMCQHGTLRIIAVLTAVSVIKKILRHLKLAVDPPPIAPARQAAFAWDFSSP